MSATALLQKAAQMGATASSNINSPMMQKSFVTGMAGPDQLCSMRTSSYGGIQQLNSSYDQIQPQTDQSQLVGMDNGGFTNQFLQKGPQEMSSQFFETTVGAENSGINAMGMLSGMFMGGDQHHGFLKNIEHENSSGTDMLQGRIANSGLGMPVGGRNPTGPTRFGGSGGGDMTTVDFLGIGGSRTTNFHEQQHQQQQQGLEFEAISQQRMQGLHPFQQHISHRQAGMEKTMWDV